MCHDNQDETEAKSGSGSAAGASVGPEALPSPSEEPNETSETSVESIPIGFPVSPDELERLKRQAEQGDEADAPESSGQDHPIDDRMDSGESTNPYEPHRTDAQSSSREEPDEVSDAPERDIPVGLPVSPDEFARLKKQAEQGDQGDAPETSAQDDPIAHPMDPHQSDRP